MQHHFYPAASVGSSSSNSAQGKRVWIDEDVDMEDATLPSPSKQRHLSSSYGHELAFERTRIMMMEGQRRMQQESIQERRQIALQQHESQQQRQLRATTPLYSGKGKAVGPINAFQLMFKSQQTTASPRPSLTPVSASVTSPATSNSLAASQTQHQQQQALTSKEHKQYPSGHECPNDCLATFQQPGTIPPSKCTFCERPLCLECCIKCRSCDDSFCGACSTPMYDTSDVTHLCLSCRT